nr:hypothetical protein [Sphingomonas sp. IC-56]
MNHTQGAAAPTFDAAAWLHTLTELGGGYALASGRKLWLVVDQVPADDLTSLMSVLVGHPDRQEAVRATIQHRQAGEVLS